MVVLAARIFSPPGGFQDRDTAACCDYALRAGTALCHSDGRGFEPHRSPASTSTPPGTGAFFTPGDAGNRRPLPLAARSNEIIQPEAWSACWCNPLRGSRD